MIVLFFWVQVAPKITAACYSKLLCNAVPLNRFGHGFLTFDRSWGKVSQSVGVARNLRLSSCQGGSLLSAIYSLRGIFRYCIVMIFILVTKCARFIEMSNPTLGDFAEEAGEGLQS